MKRFFICSLILAVTIFPLLSHAQQAADGNTLKPFLTKQGYTAIPMQRLITGHLYIKGKLNNVEGMFIIDSGAGATVLEASRKDKFKIKASTTEAEKAIGAGEGMLEVATSEHNKLQLHDYTDADFTIRLISLESINGALRTMGIIEADGIIGADIFTIGEAVIDYKNMMVYLKQGA